MRYPALGVLAILSALSCAQTDSENVRNAGLQLQARVTDDGAAATMFVHILVGDTITATRAKLSGEDALSGTVMGVAKGLSQSTDPILHDVGYRATWSGGHGGEETTLTFARKVDASLPGNRVTIPPAFKITAPTPDQATTRAAGFAITWDPAGAGGTVTVTVTGACIQHYSKQTADNGTLTIAAAEILMQPPPDGGAPVDTCPADVQVERVASGDVDKGFGEGGAFAATQVRQIRIKTAP